MMQTVSKKTVNGWAMYDWANSVYNLVITSTIFPAYYNAITTTTVNGHSSHMVDFLGWHISSGSLYNYAISFAYLIIALLSPILSSVADFRGSKKSFLRFFCTIGSLSCCSLYFFTADRLPLGIFACIIAAIGYCGSLVFYNSYLPEIAPPHLQDKVSAKGYALGYIGSVILQLVCLYLIQMTPFGLDAGHATRISFLLVGIWWFGFAQWTFAVLPNIKTSSKTEAGQRLTSGFQTLVVVWKEIRQLPVLRNYLFGFFFYSMGVQTVMLAAALFGSQELNVPTGQLIIAILLIQIVAIGGAYSMAKLSEKIGNINVIMIAIILWILICIIAYNIYTINGFYIVAVLVGLVMGGIQSMSRSTYSKLMPKTDNTTSFFSFFDVTEKLGIVIGTFCFGLVQQLTGSMRKSIVALIVFFVIGMLGMWLTKNKLNKKRTGCHIAKHGEVELN